LNFPHVITNELALGFSISLLKEGKEESATNFSQAFSPYIAMQPQDRQAAYAIAVVRRKGLMFETLFW
jgi:hypothetical protein